MALNPTPHSKSPSIQSDQIYPSSVVAFFVMFAIRVVLLLLVYVAETSGAAQRWDPSARPKSHANSDLARAARATHLAVPPRGAVGGLPEPKVAGNTFYMIHLYIYIYIQRER